MSVTMEIRENGHVMFYQYREPIDLRELNPLYDEDARHRDSVDFTTHTLLDMTGVRHLPQGILGARIGSPVLSHKRSGKIVVVGAESFARAIADVILKITRKEAMFFKTADQGEAYLRQCIAQEPRSTAPTEHVSS